MKKALASLLFVVFVVWLLRLEADPHLSGLNPLSEDHLEINTVIPIKRADFPPHVVSKNKVEKVCQQPKHAFKTASPYQESKLQSNYTKQTNNSYQQQSPH
jgi:hypothetical protein